MKTSSSAYARRYSYPLSTCAFALIIFLFLTNMTSKHLDLLVTDEEAILYLMNNTVTETTSLQSQFANTGNAPSASVTAAEDMCSGRRIHMYDLPPRFNSQLLKKCNKTLVTWLDYCQHTQNRGLGRIIPDKRGWYATDWYMMEVIFHNRMKEYPCLVSSPEAADAFFIPYYSGLDALRFLYGDDRHRASQHGLDLLSWLEKTAGPTWKRRGGRDHFMLMARTAWDFVRPLTARDGWGTSLLQLRQLENVTALLLEGRAWQPREQAVPYPTSFHPLGDGDLGEWTETVRSSRREFVFAFVGATREGLGIRQAAMEQCVNSSVCAVLDCGKLKCGHNPMAVTEKLLTADFCLQPPGDTPTRRSTFDGLVAGCIPVFFRKESAYEQYTWHLPGDSRAYSVFIPEERVVRGEVRLEDVLKSFSPQQIATMRENIVRIIPNLIYFNFGTRNIDSKDAFDLSVEGVLRRFRDQSSTEVGL